MRVTYKQAIPFLLAGAICFQLLALNILTKRLWPFTLAVCVSIFFLAIRTQQNFRSGPTGCFPSTSKVPRLSCRFLLFFLVYMVSWQLFQNVFYNPNSYALDDSIDIFFDTAALLFILTVSGFYFQDVSASKKILSIAIGVAGFGALNVIASSLGFTADVDFGTSRLDIDKVRTRWVAPFAMSTGVFSATQLAACCCLAFFLFARGSQNHTRLRLFARYLIWGAFGISLWAVYLCEQRAHLLVICSTLAAIFVPFWRKIWWQIGLGLMFIVPALEILNPGFMIDTTSRVFQEFAPTSIARIFSDAASLESRSNIWAYGVEILARPSVFFLGEGPVLRDANPALAEAYTQARVGATTSFHSSAIDLFVTSGAVVGSLVMTSIIFICMYLNRSFHLGEMNLIVTYASVWTWLGIMDGGIFAKPELMVLALAPLASIPLSALGIKSTLILNPYD